jgi:hypothetical protein
MSVKLLCPRCSKTLDGGYLYVRGFAASLHWSTQSDTRFWSRKALEQIDLGEISSGGTGAQAVIEAWLCRNCELITFRRRADGQTEE